MARIDNFEITVNRPEPIFYAGEVIEGNILLVNKDVIEIEQLYIHVKGEGSTSWLNKTSEQAFSFGQVYLDRIMDIPLNSVGAGSVILDGKDDRATTINPGSHILPFKIPLPPELPSSVEGEWGFIRYNLRAVSEIPGNKSIVCTLLNTDPSSNSVKAAIEFQVVTVLDLRANPMNVRPVETDDLLQFYQCCCIKMGHIKASLRLHKLAFAINEPIVISAEVANRSRRRINNVTAKIIKHFRFYGQSEFLQTDELKESNVLVGTKNWGEIPPRTRQIFELEVIPIHEDSKIIPTQVNFAVNIEYSLVFEIEPAGLQLEVPLIIGSIPTSK